MKLETLLRGLMKGVDTRRDVIPTVLKATDDKAYTGLVDAGYFPTMPEIVPVGLGGSVQGRADLQSLPLRAELMRRGNVAGVAERSLGEVELPDIGDAPVHAYDLGRLTAAFAQRFGLGPYTNKPLLKGESVVYPEREITLAAGSPKQAYNEPDVYTEPPIPVSQRTAAHEIGHQIAFPNFMKQHNTNLLLLVNNNVMDLKDIPNGYAEMINLSRIARPEEWRMYHAQAGKLANALRVMSPEDAIATIRQPANRENRYLAYLTSEPELFADMASVVMTNPQAAIQAAPTVAAAFKRFWNGVKKVGVRTMYNKVPAITALAWAFSEAYKLPDGDNDPRSLMRT